MQSVSSIFKVHYNRLEDLDLITGLFYKLLFAQL